MQKYWIAPLFSLLGSALDLNFSDINVASLDKELEDQDNNGLGLTSKTLLLLLVLACTGYTMLLMFKHLFSTIDQRLLGGSAPVNIPGSLARSSSLHSSSSLSASPLSSLSQSLSQSLLTGMASQQSQPQAAPVKTEHGHLGTPTSTQNSLGENRTVWRSSYSRWEGSKTTTEEYCLGSISFSNVFERSLLKAAFICKKKNTVKTITLWNIFTVF